MCISMIIHILNLIGNSHLARTAIFGLSCIGLLLMTGCVSYKVPTESFINEQGTNEQALSHWLYAVVPRHSSQIHWYDAGHWLSWSLFGNDDDGIFGEECDYKPDLSIGIAKASHWYLRNPFHNFCFYVIGSASRDNPEFLLLKLTNQGVDGWHYNSPSNFGNKGTSFMTALHGGKPFISLRIAWTPNKISEFYLGWRERGNFGAKCILLKKNPHSEQLISLNKK